MSLRSAYLGFKNAKISSVKCSTNLVRGSSINSEMDQYHSRMAKRMDTRSPIFGRDFQCLDFVLEIIGIERV